MSKKNKKNFVDGRTPQNPTQDGFANFAAKLGGGTGSLIEGGGYRFTDLITRNRTELEAGYRGSWIIGKAVDIVADDMTREGIEIVSDHEPQEITKLQKSIDQLGIFKGINKAIRWARLFGGSIAVMMIDGHDLSMPLNYQTVRKGSFKGLYVLDRWRVQPTFNELIKDFGPDFGMPMFYNALGDIDFPSVKIHHSRVIRFDGIEMPYYQMLAENRWGISIIERMWDRLIASDSTTHGAAQLVFLSHLRIIGVKGLREALSIGGVQEEAIIKQFQYISQLQSIMKSTILDANDTFNTHSYTFSGLSDVMSKQDEQIAGATDIPLIRFYGMTTTGFANGETDLRNYYDKIHKERENQLTQIMMSKLLPVLCQAVLDMDMPEDLTLIWPSLWQMSDTEKADIAGKDVDTILKAFNARLISQQTALKELKAASRITGRFSNITDEEISKAEAEIPNDDEFMKGIPEIMGPSLEQGKKKDEGTAE